MKKFSDLNITIEKKSFSGDKIPIDELIDKEILIHYFKLGESKCFKESECLKLQISIDGEMRVLFTSAMGMIEQIQKTKEDDFPFTAKIIAKTISKNKKRYEFE